MVSYSMHMLYLVFVLVLLCFSVPSTIHANERFFPIQAIDTMKLSRDRARQGLTPEMIDMVVRRIAETGATHVAIGTPYDIEFVPVIAQWVAAARQNGLSVWFRGNAAGWEEWFEYPRINRRLHTLLIKDFIISNPSLFADGDIFVSCPECENGGPGDPRETQDIAGFRAFLIQEYMVTKDAFKEIHVDVKANYYSMNGDVARLIMDRPTTKALDGVVTIDHYVKDVDVLIKDIKEYHDLSGGRIVLGEWGAPIPDIHGAMTQTEQARYIKSTFTALRKTGLIDAVNYWTGTESSTELWGRSGEAYAGVAVLTSFYKPHQLTIRAAHPSEQIITQFAVHTPGKTYSSMSDTWVTVPYLDGDELSITKAGYSPTVIHPVHKNISNNAVTVTMTPEHTSRFDELIFRIEKLFRIFSIFEKV